MEKVRKMFQWIMEKVRKMFQWIKKKVSGTFLKIRMFLKEAMKKRSKDARWLNIATLLTGFAAFEIYRSLSFADAEYQGEKLLYYFSVIAPYVIWAVIGWEFICVVGLRRWIGIFTEIQKKWKSVKQFIDKCSLRRRLFIFVICIGMTVMVWIRYNYMNECDTEYYKDVMEFYGIPDGVGEPLSPKELEGRSGYWRIDDYPRKHCIILTYVDDYGQMELMRQYSSAYNMAFFQPAARIEYYYRENEEKFHSYGRECYDLAKEHGFREPEKVIYYASNGKVLLELSGDGYEKLRIDTYSSEDVPQLFHSTLLRFPNGETMENGISSWQIENSYDSKGMPVMRKLSTGVCNRYGINGERYTYDSDNRLASICYLDVNGMPVCNKQGIMLITFQYDEDRVGKISYYSDENGMERTEGFFGVCCEEIQYDSNGNIEERRQKDAQGRWCCDDNGVYKYVYKYDKGRLESETYYGVDELPVRSNQMGSQSVRFSLEKERKKTIIKVFLDSIGTSLVSSDVQEITLFQNDYSTKPVYSSKLVQATEAKEFLGKQTELQEQNMGSGDESGNVLYDNKDSEGDQTNRKENEQEKKRNYTLIQNILTSGSLIVEYLDENGANIKNEWGYAAKKVLYDERMRVMEEAYLDLDGELCLIEDGYAVIKTTYHSKSDDKKESIEYLGKNRERTMNKKEGYSLVCFQYGRQGESEVVTSFYRDSMENPIYLPKLGYATVDRLYNKNGFLIQETYRDMEGVITYRNDYMVAEILYEYADDGNLSRIWYKDVNEEPTNRFDTGYAVVYQEYEAGQLVRRHYEGYRNQVLCAVPDKTTGICDTVYYYTKGRKQREQYFDTEGNPALRSDIGCAAIGYEYDKNGNISKRRYYGTDGKLILRKDTGYAIVEYKYNDEDQCKLIRYLGVDEQPIINREEYCAGIKEFYEGDNLVEIQYLDFDDSLMNRSDYGVAKVRRTYDAAGNIETEAYFDANGDRAVHKEYGYAMFENFYNEDGTLKECRYYDFLEDQRELVVCKDTGYAIVRYGYDDNGNRNSCTYFDTEDRPVISTKYHCAGILSENDIYGNATVIQYIDLDGRLLNRDDYGFAQVRKEYDPKNGNLLREVYLDTEGLPAIRKEYGCASYEQSYDERGNLVETRYYNKESDLTLRENTGYAIIHKEYNEYGELSAEYFYGEHEEAIISTEYHCAGFLYTYDKKGKWIQTIYLGLDGKMAVRSDYGCAYTCYQYDDAGRLIEVAYFDMDGSPVIRKDCGYASYKNTYEGVRMVEQRYYGVREELVPDKETGYAIVKWEYDKYGNNEKYLFYGVDEKPVISSKYQCAGIKSGYDEKGNTTEIRYLDFEGELMNLGDYGYAKICLEYDGSGNVLRTLYLDAEEKPVLRKDCGCASYEQIYDARTGKWIESRYYDTQGELTLRKDTGYAVIKLEYDSYGREKIYTYYGADEQAIITSYYCCAGMKYVYDEKGNRTKIQYLSVDGSLMTRVDLGCAQISKKYSDSGRLIGEEYLDLEGKPTVRKEYGYASYENVFAGNGILLESRYYGMDSNPVLREDMGYAVVKYGYDEYGRRDSECFYGVKEEPIISTKYKCAEITYSYENGNEVEIRYYGLDGQLINRNDYGCAQIRKEYDNFGFVIKISYIDVDGKTVIRKDVGYAICNSQYDPYHRWVEDRYYDAQENPMLNWETGTAMLKLDYDAYGRKAQYTYYGIDEQPILNTKYFCYGMRYSYDELGNQTEIQYLDPNGEMMIRSDYGCAQIKQEYDAIGQLKKESYCDANGRLVLRPEYGYAAYTINYEKGRKAEVQYLGVDEKPIARKDTGYAIIRYTYNELGQCDSKAYYDADEQPIISKKDNCAMYKFWYDERGNRNYIWYCGLDGNFFIREDYGAMLNFRVYDEYDRMIWDKYYIYDGSEFHQVDRKDVGYSAVQYIYNEQGKKESKQYFDMQDNLVMPEEYGYAACEWLYNENGQLEYLRYYDADMKPVTIPEGYAEIEYIYDASGNVAEWISRDASGRELSY